MTRNVFLDCGTHFGQGLSEFIKRFNMNSSWIVHSFEANPKTYEINMQDKKPLSWVTYHNEAVHDKEGTVTINVESPPGEGETGMGSSLIGLDQWSPWDGKLRDNFKTSYEVPAIHFSKFILDNFNNEDNIIIKMDIEGAEFAVVEDLLASGAMSHVKFIAIEWHSQFFTNKEEMKQKETSLIERIKALEIAHENWY